MWTMIRFVVISTEMNSSGVAEFHQEFIQECHVPREILLTAFSTIPRPQYNQRNQQKASNSDKIMEKIMTEIETKK